MTLVGLITKHGILIVEFSNQLRAKGEAHARRRHRCRDAAAAADPDDDRRDGARRGAARARARARAPESRTQIGWVIVGGMAFGTLLTLFVVPTAYTLLARRSGRTVRWTQGTVAGAASRMPGAAATDRA